MESYRGLREYLVRVRKHLDKVRPQLGRNVGLVERLARWEESWDRLAFYTGKPDLMEGARLLVGFLAGSLEAAPSMQQMLDHRAPELFLVLPRLACLCLLSDPECPVAQLLRPLLPSLFASDSEVDQEDDDQGPFTTALAASAELEGVLDLLGGPAGHDGAWDALTRRAVAGAGARAAADLYPETDPGQQEAAAAAVEGLMREVEGWSMELQRHNPAAWNDLSDLLVHCMVWKPGDAEEPRPARLVL
ncbi:unnamed protein product [Prorocentrum cordatum]|uniref:Uncharacterized protein n=1 Tax=Prorocentrum cordatum TaxID=2364126 RepID=A0ABN9TFP0_9DINO|nr:unnamed protein product [Polarella glacialis]